MPEAILEKVKCKACGTDVREGSLFCYHCGERVSEEAGGPSSGDDIRGEKGEGGTSVRDLSNSAFDRPISMPIEPLTKELQDDQSRPGQAFQKRPRRSAGTIKPREVEWVARSQGFWRPLLAAILIGLFVSLMMVAAWVLK